MADPEIEEQPQIVEACSACGTLMDVSNETPYSQVYCPSCGQSLRVRKQFNNFTLLELLGEGGMGSVFKSMDLNLKRNVALKILRRECSANVEEREKLAQEARLTASINHPHVVKVYSFGEDHGQFYLAMELVEKGSLDELMGIQKRVAEVQILEVGIQIAAGLQAALEVGLIHRDIKPGNILFADAHTAKLVDFGLALVMDEAASERGEIWGTPYYIAPEKLDHQPEDFRSDIYSLGGTLFHAIAGRPPYEATTASMVALKQLKSLPVSLQSFAPDVSSETAYVINRMLAKSPDDRYATYEELIEHLSYARQKLLERAQKPVRTKERAIVQSRQQKNAMGLIVLGLVLIMLIAGGLAFVFRSQVAEALGINTAKPRVGLTASDYQSQMNEARQMLIEGRYGDAREVFARLAADASVPRPDSDWAQLNVGLSQVLANELEEAKATFGAIQNKELFSLDDANRQLANFFPEAGRIMALSTPVAPGTLQVYAKNNYEAFAFLLYGLKDWQLGKIEEGGEILRQFLKTEPVKPWDWIHGYDPIAQKFIDDYNVFAPLSMAFKNATTPETKAALLERVREAKGHMQTGEAVGARLDQMETKLSE